MVYTGSVHIVRLGARAGGNVFLPCCYGWATTIRRAQGASLTHGCVYFEQRKHAAARGYGYVAVSRFRTRAGVHLYGKLRRTDFLPVKEPSAEEVLYRTEYSASEDSNAPESMATESFDGRNMETNDIDEYEGAGGMEDLGIETEEVVEYEAGFDGQAGVRGMEDDGNVIGEYEAAEDLQGLAALLGGDGGDAIPWHVANSEVC